MNISWEKLGGWMLGIGFWKDEDIYWLLPNSSEDAPIDYYFNIYLIFGFLEIRVRVGGES